MAYRYVGLIFAVLSVLQKNRQPFFFGGGGGGGGGGARAYFPNSGNRA